MTKSSKISLLALVLCLAMCLSLGACSKNGGEEDTSAQLTAFIDSLQDQLDSMTESLGDTMDIKISARGNSLVYSYQYKIDLGMDNEVAAESLSSSMDAVESTFTSVLSELQKAVPGAESIIVEHLDNAGNVITSKEFQ